MPLPIPEDDDPKMAPQTRLFEFLQPSDWMEVFTVMGNVRQEPEPNVLYDSCQAVMAEVGYQHWVRAKIIDALEPDSPSLEDIVSAIEDLRSRKESGPAVEVEATPVRASNDAAGITLAVQRALARVVDLPSQLPPALFIDLCEGIAEEIINGPRTVTIRAATHGLPQASGPSGNSGVQPL